MALKVGDVTTARVAVRVIARLGKGNKRREVHLPGAAGKLLKDYIEWFSRKGLPSGADAPLFPTRSGTAMTRSGAWRAWSRVLEAAGVEHRPLHAARHTAGTSSYRATKDLRLVQQHLGHARAETASIYAGVLDEDVEAGVEASWR